MSFGIVGAASCGIAVLAAAFALAFRDRAPLHGLGWGPHPDAAALNDAGWSAGLARWEALRGAATLVTLAVAMNAGLPAAVAAIGAVAPSVWIRVRAESARERARRAMTRMLVTTEAALRSGTALPDALRRALDVGVEPLARRPLITALREFDLGASLESGLREAASQERDPRIALPLGTLGLGIGERLPRERLADLLASLGDRLAFDERLDDEVRARASGVRQQQRLIAVVVPGIALYLVATMPALGDALDAPLGRFVLVPGAIALEAAGILLARRIVGHALR